MYYILYLASLCHRRHWPEPLYESYPGSTTSNTGTGYTCTVRVNNREYQTDVACESEIQARESAAMRAYLICRNFSVNDGMYPVGHDHGGVVQGMPVAIGTGRKGRFVGGDELDGASFSSGLSSSGESGSGSLNGSVTGSFSSSGGSSPERYEIVGRFARERERERRILGFGGRRGI